MNNKLVSVIIPSFNATQKLKQAIDSVFCQTYDSFEIIVVDDNDANTNSRRFTEQIVSEYLHHKNFHYIQHKKNQNGAAARNTGIRLSKGEYIAFLDDDDVYYPKRLELCVKAIGQSKEYGAVYTDCDIFKDGIFLENRKAIYDGFVWKELLLNEGMLGTGSNLFIKKDCVKEVGYFDERFIRYQDVEYMLRFLVHHKLLKLNDTLVKKNIEDTNIPKYSKYKENKELIFSKFDYLISKLSHNERNLFFEKQYNSLLLSAIDSCNRAYIKEAKKNYSKYAHISFKTKIKCLFPKLYKAFRSNFKH